MPRKKKAAVKKKRRAATPEEQLQQLLAANPGLLQSQTIRNLDHAAAAQSISGNAFAFNESTIQLIFNDAGFTKAEARALATYLETLCERANLVPFVSQKNPDRVDATGRRPSEPELQRIYVDLNVRERKPDENERESSAWPARDACAVPENHRLALLGEPGSGKSTFLRILALEYARQFEENAASRPDSPAVPIFLTLRDFAAADLSAAKKPEARIPEFLKQTLAADNLEDALTPLRTLWREGRAIFLLDGLDEIGSPERRRFVIEAIEAFANSAHARDCRFIVTCRVAAYRAPETDDALPGWRLAGFPVLTLAAFSEEQIRRFIQAWYEELRAKGGITSDPVGKARSLQRALSQSHIRRLAPNPLLLTVMAIVHGTEGKLPNQRVTLYQEAVDILLHKWRGGRDPSDDPDEQHPIEQLLAEAQSDLQRLRNRLFQLALDVHAKTPEGKSEAVADIPQDDLECALRTLHPDKCREWTAKMIEAIKQRSGLLIEPRDRVFTFPHRTFQEYLAARKLALEPEFTEIALEKHDAGGSLWREVILLACGHFSHYEDRPDRAFELVERLRSGIRENFDEAGRPDEILTNSATVATVDDLVLAAHILREMNPGQLADSDAGSALLENLRQQLLTEMFDQNRHTPPERARLGSALGWIGDPRPGVRDLEDVRNPAFWSAPIEPGPFPMGNDDRHSDEKRRFDCDLIEARYAVSRHPVTVAQFQQFIDAGGYDSETGTDDFWTPEGLEWRRENKIDAPENYDEVFQTPNHPQAGVSHHEAVAFCAWLAAKSGLPIRLPEEWEWERAARHTDERTYPWGEASDKEVAAKANIWQTGIKTTSAVGLFAGGAAECEALDLSGNVIEWTKTRWKDDYFGYPGEQGDVNQSVVWRGGAWDTNPDYARCACRGRDLPLDRYDYLGFRVCVSPFEI